MVGNRSRIEDDTVRNILGSHLRPLSTTAVLAVLTALSWATASAQNQRVFNLGNPPPSGTPTPQDSAQPQRIVTMAAPDGQPYRIGGVPIELPPPSNQFVDPGRDYLGFMELTVPTGNRFLAGFVLTEDLPFVRSGHGVRLSRFAMVQVMRRGEFMEMSATEFKKVTEQIDQGLGKVLNSTLKESEEEFNHRMKSLHLENVQLSIGKPVQLGCFFSKPDAYSIGFIVPVSANGTTLKMVNGSVFVRAKDRLLFLYLYAEYKDQDTLKWMRRTSEDWADAVLKANTQ